MTDKILVDTNILVYAYDDSEPIKQKKALDVLKRLVHTGSGVLTTQVLAEFFNAVTKKIADPLPLKEAARQVEMFARAWPVLSVTPFTVIEAARGVTAHKMSFWDAQIWASALLHQMTLVYSEDFRPGSVIEGVRFENPFSPAPGPL